MGENGGNGPLLTRSAIYGKLIEKMTVALKFYPAKYQFYCPTLKRYYGRKKLNEMIRDGTITRITFLGTRDEREKAIAYLSYAKPKTIIEAVLTSSSE